MIGTMIAAITRGIRADDVSSRLAGAGGRAHARDQMIRSPWWPFRWSHVAPATAPGTITAPMAMNQVMRLKTTPSVPYSLLPEMIAEEKQAEENTRGRSRTAP